MARQSGLKMSHHIINEHPKSNKLINKFDKKCSNVIDTHTTTTKKNGCVIQFKKKNLVSLIR